MRTRRSWRNQERMWQHLGGVNGKVPFLPALTTPRNIPAMQWPVEEDKDPLFIGIMPAGIGYCDRRREEHGDYVKVAFLSYRTLVLDIYKPKSDLLARITADADEIIARRGQEFVVSGCGQTVLLGGR